MGIGSKRDLKVVKALVILGLVVLLVIIILQNTEAVDTRLLFVTVTMPRALLLFVHLALGYVLGIMTMLFMSGRGRSASAQ